MAVVEIQSGGLFQGGRVSTPSGDVGQSYIAYRDTFTTDEYLFRFPSGASTSLTFGIPSMVFIDNANNDHEMQVVVSVTNQTFPIPANATGLWPIDASDGSTVSVTSAGNASGKVEVIFYNYNRASPFVYYKYGTNQVTVTVPDGADVALGSTDDPVIVNPLTNATLLSYTKGILTQLVNIATNTVTSLTRLTSIVTNTNAYNFVNISTSTTTAVKATPGTLGSITINSLGTVASTTTVYNSLSGSGSVIAIIDSLTQSGTFTFDAIATIGITVVTTGTVAPNVTITYK